MKKKLIILAGSLMALAICATTFFATNSTSEMSLLMRNVEVLAQSEGGGTDQCWHDTVDDGSAGLYIYTVNCHKCEVVTATNVSNKGTCNY